MRLIGFQDSQRKRLADFQSASQDVSINNCTIKRARKSDDLEVILKSNSRVIKSPNKFDICLQKSSKGDTALKDLPQKSVYCNVSVKAKVIQVNDSVKLANGLSKQDVTIANSTAVAQLVVWEDDIDKLTEYESKD